MMENEFQLSMMGELTFFLGIQVKQIKEGTFVHQAKYTKDLIKKFAMADAKPVSTSMSMMTALDPDEDGMATWPDIQLAMCLCACFWASPRLHIVK
jgi:hypothetical protein